MVHVLWLWSFMRSSSFFHAPQESKYLHRLTPHSPVCHQLNKNKNKAFYHIMCGTLLKECCVYTVNRLPSKNNPGLDASCSDMVHGVLIAKTFTDLQGLPTEKYHNHKHECLVQEKLNLALWTEFVSAYLVDVNTTKLFLYHMYMILSYRIHIWNEWNSSTVNVWHNNHSSYNLPLFLEKETPLFLMLFPPFWHYILSLMLSVQTTRSRVYFAADWQQPNCQWNINCTVLSK